VEAASRTLPFTCQPIRRLDVSVEEVLGDGGMDLEPDSPGRVGDVDEETASTLEVGQCIFSVFWGRGTDLLKSNQGTSVFF